MNESIKKEYIELDISKRLSRELLWAVNYFKANI